MINTVYISNLCLRSIKQILITTNNNWLTHFICTVYVHTACTLCWMNKEGCESEGNKCVDVCSRGWKRTLRSIECSHRAESLPSKASSHQHPSLIMTYRSHRWLHDVIHSWHFEEMKERKYIFQRVLKSERRAVYICTTHAYLSYCRLLGKE